ncbi:CPBP family intramembrane metalloprotease [Sporolactobacillus shoreicorticis]|uniref:CPBP family intramembrane glutamic endopeptidase n=1 Tax=Sporolactobacillus shoreicorticis TaxID=1923877 RepID=A0ABW5S6U4_9BACL|nr:type II CAAX endopeptidase family protein [Sporolactobacillus shoreicorticis]MCO7125561.1 CPBP family intramembrane metalloprotease [Sporolactobacillus shoreicorticis]
MNEIRKERKKVKKYFRHLGITLLFQTGVLWSVVGIYLIVLTLQAMFLHPHLTEQQFEARVITPVSESGWPMIAAVLVAFIPLLIYRKKKFFTYDLRTTKRRMTVNVFVLGLIAVLGVNAIISSVMYPVEWLLNLFGYTADPSKEILEGSKTTSMLVYTCLIGPILEEFVYRGVVMRSLERFGSVFAITISALLFSMMHGNIIQIPMAFAIGIVLGYLAKTYGIWLTVLIHIANNLFSEGFSALPSAMWSNVFDIIMAIVFIGTGCAFLNKNKRTIKEKLSGIRGRLPEKRLWLYFFTSIPMILLLLSNLVVTILGVEKL